jgi:segregation and condensation protein A
LNRFWAFVSRVTAAVTRFWARLFDPKREVQGSLAPPEAPDPLTASQPTQDDITDAEYEEIDDARPSVSEAEDKARAEREQQATLERERAEAQRAEAERVEKERDEAERQAAAAAQAQRQRDEEKAAREAKRAEAQRKAEEERVAREEAKAEARRKAEDAREAAARAAQEARRKADEDKAAARALAEELRDKAAQEKAAAKAAQKAAADETRRKAEAERAAAKAAVEEEKRQAAEAKAAAKTAADEAKRVAAAEKAAVKAAADEAERKASEEAAAKLAVLEEAKRRAAEAEAARIAAIEAARRRELEAKKAAIEIPKDYQAAPESSHSIYQLNLDAFDGPLDLLLFLIRRHEVDILDIPMAFICERYLDYLKAMEDLNIDVASEFMFMAAELLHIKSKMLLPKPVDVEGEEEEGDPRSDLVRRLLEYQKYKTAAEELDQYHWFGRDTFGRAPERIERGANETPLKEVSVFALIEAFDAILARQKPEFRHQVMMEQSSVKERMRRLVTALVGQAPQPFEELLGPICSRLDVVVTFLALLEMAKMQLMKIFESEGGTLYLAARFADMEEASRVLDNIEDKTLYAG